MSCPALHRALEQAHQIEKLFSTLQARAALRGFSLVMLADGSFMITRWNMVRPLADLRAVSRFLEEVGA